MGGRRLTRLVGSPMGRAWAEGRRRVAELPPEGVGEVAVIRVAEVERQGREVRRTGCQPVQGQAEPQAVEIPS